MRKMGKWTDNEDNLLKELVIACGKNWSKIAGSFPNRTAAQISSRWEKCLDPSLHKGPFTLEEDEKILDYVKKNGPKDWRPLSELLGARSPKQCRERWVNSLNPGLSKDSWTLEEDRIIFEAHSQHGGKWALIARLLPGRSDNAIKNRWNSSISKRIQREQTGVVRLLPEKIKKAPEITFTPAKKPKALAPIQIPQQRQNTSVEIAGLQPIRQLMPERPSILPQATIVYPGVEINLFSPSSPFPGTDLFSPSVHLYIKIFNLREHFLNGILRVKFMRRKLKTINPWRNSQFVTRFIVPCTLR